MNKWILVLGVVIVALSGCGGSTEDLQQWTKDVRARSSERALPRAVVVEPPVEFTPYPYHGDGLMSPFNPSKLLALLRSPADTGGICEKMRLEMDRVREGLESFPMESVRMVGSMMKANDQVALLNIDNGIYPIKVGSYLGPNLGKVLRITETTVDLRELIQTGPGECTERPVTLRLQEGQS